MLVSGMDDRLTHLQVNELIKKDMDTHKNRIQS